MKISVDDKELFTLSDTQKKVIQNNIPSDVFESDMKRRIHYILTHKYEECFKELKQEWEPKLKLAGIKSIPLDDEEFARLVLSQPNYKDRKMREDESQSQQ